MRRNLLVLLAVLALVGCGSSSDDGSSTTEAPAETLATTPRPDAQAGAELEAAVAAIYPGVPAGKATDWAVSICRDVLDGVAPADLVDRTVARFAGGSRPDPTPEQAESIVAAVRAAGFCS